MIILRENAVNTTTQLTSSNGTLTFANLFDNDKDTQWISDNAGTDATSATLRVVFSVTQTVSQIILLNTNLKSFSIHPNTTTNNFTPPINKTTNSSTNLYFSVSTMTTISEIVCLMNSTIIANNEKAIGELIVTNLLYDFSTDRLPTAEQYHPRIFRKQIRHEMSDGGISLYNIRNKFSADIAMDFVPTSTANILRTIYDLGSPFLFIPFETTTSWDGNIAECVWTGDFSFFEFSDNNLGNGFRGNIEMRQTVGGNF